MGRATKTISLSVPPKMAKKIKGLMKEDFDWDKEQIGRTIERIKNRTIEVQPEVKILVIKGKGDNHILECAIAGKAQYIVPGDKHHILPLKEYQGIRILSPAAFLEVRLFNYNDSL